MNVAWALGAVSRWLGLGIVWLFAGALPLAAALPQIFQEQEEAAGRSVLPHVRRSGQDTLEGLEDAVSVGAAGVLRLFNNIALQTTFDRGAELRLRHKLTEEFYPKGELYEADAVFFREALARLDLQYRGTNLIAKRLVAGKPVYLLAQAITLDVGREVSNQTDAQSANGVRSTLRYHVSAWFRVAREWNAGRWGEWQQRYPVGEFELVVYPPLDKRERIINDGRIKRELIHDFGLSPMGISEFPAPPLAERFPLLSRLARLSTKERLIALEKLARADDTEAQYLLGVAYERGEAAPGGWKEARTWYVRAAKQHYEPALYRLARNAFKQGTGVDDPQAMEFLTDAVNHGDMQSLALMGSVLVRDRRPSSRGADPVAQGQEYLEYAARAGEPLALYTLGERLVRGLDASRPASQALDLLQQAAQKRSAEAAFLLGDVYRSGKLVTRNPLEAWKWFFLAGRWSTSPGEEAIRARIVEPLLQLRDELSEDQLEIALKGIQRQEASTPPKEEL